MSFLSGGFAFLPCRLLFAVVYKRIGKMRIYCIVIRLSVLITLLLVMLQFSLRFLANFSDTVAFPPDCTTPAYPPFDRRGADRRPRAHDRFAQAVPQLITTRLWDDRYRNLALCNCRLYQSFSCRVTRIQKSIWSLFRYGYGFARDWAESIILFVPLHHKAVYELTGLTRIFGR